MGCNLATLRSVSTSESKSVRIGAQPARKEILYGLFLKTLNRISLDELIPRKVSCRDGVLKVGGERIDLKSYARIIVITLGKAAFEMAEVMANILDPFPLTGVVTGPSPSKRKLPGFECFYGGHPFPNSDSFKAGQAIVERLGRVTPQDLVLYLLSGGGSAICEKPISPEIHPQDCEEFYKLLVTCGSNIIDVNFIRKHFSAIKGGRLTELAYPARQVTFYVSDAPPGNPSNVASGPTMPDESTLEDCHKIIRKYGLIGKFPPSLRRMLDEERIPETPKPGAEIFQSSTWHCLLTPEDAVKVLAEETRKQGWVVETDLSVDDDCPLTRATHHLLSRLGKLRRAHPGRTVAIVTGGEYCCPVNGDGLGGRNQAFVLDCVPEIAGRNITILSAGTDGVDGISPAAGAVAAGSTLERAARLGLNPADYARCSDSYGFFSMLEDALITGPTGNNVRDLRILVEW